MCRGALNMGNDLQARTGCLRLESRGERAGGLLLLRDRGGPTSLQMDPGCQRPCSFPFRLLFPSWSFCPVLES